MAQTTRGESKNGHAGNEPAILVIDPNEEHQVLSTMALGRRGFRVTIAGTAREGVRIALSQRFAAIVLDIRVRDMPALEVLSLLAERLADVPKIFVVSAGQEATAVRALASGASGYLVKTARYNELLPSEVETQIRAAVARRSLKEQRKALGESEERFQKAFRASPIAVSLAAAPDQRFIDANDAFLALIGYSRDELIGHSDAELHVLVEDEALRRANATFEEKGAVREAEVHLRTKSGERRTASVSMDTVVIEGSPCILTIARDVTEEREAERLRSSLYDIIDATESSSGLPDLYRRIHAIIARLMPAENCYIALHDPLSDELSFPYFVDEKEPAPAPYKAGRGLTEHVIRTGEALLVTPSVLDDLVAQGAVEKVGAEGIDWLGVPLNVGGRTIGVLAVQSYAEATRYTVREKATLSFISSQVALAIDRRAAQEAVRQAEARFRTMFQDAPVGILLVSSDGIIRESNPAFLQMLGYSGTELAGRHIMDLTAPDDVGSSLRLFESLVRGERPSYVLEKRYLRKDGTVMWGRLTATLLRSPDATSVLGMIQDVTEERNALEEREASARRFHAMIEHIGDGISLVGPDGKVTWQSPSALRMFGYAPEEVLGKTAIQFMHPDDTAQLGPVFTDLMASPGKTVTAEIRVRPKDGGWRWMEVIATNLLDDPDLRSVVMNYRDITDRNEALEHIRFQASLLSQVRNAVIAIDTELRIVYWNDAAANMYGWRFAEVAGRVVYEVIGAPEDREDAAPLMRVAGTTGHWEGERTMMRKDGSRFPAAVSITALRDRQDQVVGYVGVSSDITERAMARRELEVRARQQAAIAALGQKALVETLLSALLAEAVGVLARTLEVDAASILELLPDGASFSIKAREGLDAHAGGSVPNDPHTTMAGFTIAANVPVVMEDASREDRFEAREMFADRGLLSGVSVVIPGPARPYGILCVHAKAKRHFSEDDIHFCQSIANVIADALERHRIEKILGDRERMASMGQLAAYVAHEVNTPLTNISLLASSIARREKDPEILQKINAIGEQRRKATAIIMDILEFPRERSSRRTPEDIRKAIEAAVEQVAPYRKPSVQLVVDTGDHAAFANVDMIQIRDVFTNLLKNAFEATVEGVVRVSLKELPQYLLVSVTDTGTGIAPEVLEQLFHPLSALKSPAEGAALGLAVSRSIVAAHGGKIEATSELGKGSTFTVILPRFEEH